MGFGVRPVLAVVEPGAGGTTVGVEDDGAIVTGDVQHVVIVATDPGYAGNPGHDGTGTIVATLC
jgi:hypothetical protein